MFQCTRPLVVLVWVFLALSFIACLQCHGSRSTATDVFKSRPKSQHTGNFFGFLPRHFPIPASGPSRKHNDLGLQSWKSP
ncbi:hypothetical protein HRI_002336900 [Hibiscus trionum]|uniref:Uncharacterized protein n=1 Tax=Hibiscus trionum TaxID=183268 RepID=A0A9W7M3Y8_HIBTR|nr:hypothetical protein HRI_002336900 [Hibiscus trionum]